MKHLCTIAVLLFALPAHGQSVQTLLNIERVKAGLPPIEAKPAVQQVDYDRTAKFNELLKQLKPAPPAATPRSPAPPVATPKTAPAASKPKPAPKVVIKAPPGHWETRQRKVCKGGRCVVESYRVWVSAAPKAVGGYYPTRGSWWSHPGSAASHLIREHGLSAAWVNSLSRAEQESVHSDIHDAERGNSAARSRVNQYARRR